MSTFYDAEDNGWDLKVTTGTLCRVREQLKTNLLDLFGGQGQELAGLCADPIRLGKILWVLCREQATARGMEELDFYDVLFGDALESATEALLEAVCDFFPNQKQRKSARMILAKICEMRNQLMETGCRDLEATLDRINLDESAGLKSSAYVGNTAG